MLNITHKLLGSKRITLLATLVMFCGGAMLLIQCAPKTADPGMLKTTDITVTNTEVHITGTTHIPAQVCIETLLYEDGEVVSWWPDTCAVISDDAWDLQVSLDSTLHNLKPDAEYVLRVWQRDEPAISAEPFAFDMQGPVKPE